MLHSRSLIPSLALPVRADRWVAAALNVRLSDRGHADALAAAGTPGDERWLHVPAASARCLQRWACIRFLCMCASHESRPLILGQSPSVGSGGAGQVAGGLTWVSAHKKTELNQPCKSVGTCLKCLSLIVAPGETQQWPYQRRCDQIVPFQYFLTFWTLIHRGNGHPIPPPRLTQANIQTPALPRCQSAADGRVMSFWHSLCAIQAETTLPVPRITLQPPSPTVITELRVEKKFKNQCLMCSRKEKSKFGMNNRTNLSIIRLEWFLSLSFIGHNFITRNNKFQGNYQ